MAKIYSIGGGKGGSGKSFLNANLGVVFAKQGKSVVLVDLDLGGSNLHTFLGLKNPKTGLQDFLNKTHKELDQTAVVTNIPNLYLISSTNCTIEIANLFHAQKIKIIRALKKLSFDIILLDLGAGTNFNTLDFFLSSNEGIFTITPEPTSIENAFQFIRAVYLRKVKHILGHEHFKSTMQVIRSHSGKGEVYSLKDIINTLMNHSPEKWELLKVILGRGQFNFIINQFRKQNDADLGRKIEKVCNKYFYSRFNFLGNINYDEKVHDSIFMKEVYINRYPYTKTAIDLQNIYKGITEDNMDNLIDSRRI